MDRWNETKDTLLDPIESTRMLSHFGEENRSMSMRSISGLLGILIFLVGCDLPFGLGQEDEPLLRTEGEEFELREPGSADVPVLTIPYRFVNRSGSRVFLVNCLGDVRPHMDRRVGGRWVQAYAPLRLFCLSPPVIIEPGAEYSDTLNVHHRGEMIDPSDPQAETPDLEGTYRLRWEIALSSFDKDSYPFGEPIRLLFRFSNSFVLRDP